MTDSPIGRQQSLGDRWAIPCALLLLLGAAAHRLSLPKPVDAEPYHRHIRELAAAIPMRSGDWISTDAPVPAAEREELKPNVLIRRNYEELSRGASATLLLVQYPDVRYLAPHYPPACYPGHGWTLISQKRVVLHAGETNITATRYSFESTSVDRCGEMHVDNFMVLPDGVFQPDMQGVERRIGADQRYFGGAQVQIVHAGDVGDAEETAVSNSLLQIYAGLLDGIRGGTKK
jgi:hypothetical protein